jgi:3-hydroxyisobutyrate dehydrogenase-like beta-hydroxyacid dehydrogenase
MSTNKLVKPSKTKLSVAASPAFERVGFLGLGIMGSAMAGNLMKAGFEVHGFDPTAKARQRFKSAGGHVSKDAAELVRSVDVIITSLPSPDALIETANVLARAGRKGLLVIETSTLDIKDKEAARDVMAKKGVTLLDCPLSGTGAQAARKDLTVYASGPATDIRRLVPVFEGFSKAHFDLGPFGNGMKMKLMANLLVAIHNVSTAEALLLGQRWGIKPSTAVKVLSDGAGGSRMLQVRGPMMENEGWKEVTMKISVWQKDMKLIAQALADAQVPAPLFAATIPLYNAAMGMGHESNDTAAVFDVLEKMSSISNKVAGKKTALRKR